MKRKSTIIKKLIALSLMMVFLFVYVAKALHTHDEGSSATSSNEVQVQKSNDCSVCDFHIAKDTFHQVSFPQTQQQVYLNSDFNFYQSRTNTSIGLTYSDRGPPAIA